MLEGFCLQKLPTEVEVKYPLSTQHSQLITGEVAGGNHHLPTSDKTFTRRGFLQAASALGMGSLAGCAERKPTWKKGGYRKPDRSRVAILKAAGYDRDLTSVILDLSVWKAEGNPAPYPFLSKPRLRCWTARDLGRNQQLRALFVGLKAEGMTNSSMNRFCPVQTDKLALSEYSAQHEGKPVYFCCERCQTLFKANPQAYDAWLDGSVFVRPAYSRTQASPLDVVDTHLMADFGRREWILLSLSLAALSLLLLRRKFSKKRVPFRSPSSRTLMLANVVLLALLVGMTWSCYRLWRRFFLFQLKDAIHYATYYDFGDPPIPAKPKLPKRIKGTFYRGNDERSVELFNQGNYRTCSFNLSLCSKAGGDEIHLYDDLSSHTVFLRLEIVRAAFTSDLFFSDEQMDVIVLTKQSDPFLGHLAPIEDGVPLHTTEPKQRWEAAFPLCSVAGKRRERHGGIVYVGEKRYIKNLFRSVSIAGTRFHYAVQYDLVFEDGKITSDSDLWMGALYRTRRFSQWKLPLHEWFSHEPIPELPGKNTEDPVLLGLDEYKQAR